MEKNQREQNNEIAHIRRLSLSNICILQVIVMLSVIIIPALTMAEEGSGKSIDKGYQELLRRIETLEKRLQDSETKREALTEEVNRMKAEKPATPITQEQKAPVAQAAVQTAASAPVNGVTAGWDKGPYIKSRDGKFEFRPLGILHLDFRGHEKEKQINNNDTLSSTFDVRRFRMGFEGFIFEKIGYNFEMQFDEDESEVIFAYINFGYIPWANLRVGQFKEPFSYEVLYPEKYLDFVERASEQYLKRGSC
jgi:phosphate-selective porin OprO and OprP